MARDYDPPAAINWRRPIERPIIFAGGIVLFAAVLSLIALVYLSWSSSARLDPFELHLRHFQNLQTINIEVQSALVGQAQEGEPPDQRTIEAISGGLGEMLRADGYLHGATPRRILAAQNFLLREGYSIQENLAAAFGVLQQTLKDENEVQRTAIQQSRRAAQREFMIAVFCLLALPVILISVLLSTRQRLFAWSESLSEMLENVRRSNLDPVRPAEANNPIFPVIKRYNAMVERLREIEEEHSDKEHDLEHQVQVASESLLRVQRNLAQAEQLSAIGEFSARVAHELRNPLSGITVALRNLRQDISASENLEVIDLVLDELDRISRLLDSLLARTPNEREPIVPTSVPRLCRDMITLFGYEGERNIDFRLDVPDCTCELPQDSLRQAILNVLRNSAQAMGDAGGKISLTGTISGENLTLVIEDTGPGYPEDLLRNGIRLFKTDKEGGSGLGLFILQRLIHNAGGTLSLETADTGGARTVIELPCRSVEPENDGDG